MADGYRYTLESTAYWYSKNRKTRTRRFATTNTCPRRCRRTGRRSASCRPSKCPSSARQPMGRLSTRRKRKEARTTTWWRRSSAKAWDTWAKGQTRQEGARAAADGDPAALARTTSGAARKSWRPGTGAHSQGGGPRRRRIHTDLPQSATRPHSVEERRCTYHHSRDRLEKFGAAGCQVWRPHRHGQLRRRPGIQIPLAAV